jgi:hypothetical protein
LPVPIAVGYWIFAVLVASVGVIAVLWISLLLGVGAVANISAKPSSMAWATLGAILALVGPACGALGWRAGRSAGLPGRLVVFGVVCFTAAGGVGVLAIAVP